MRGARGWGRGRGAAPAQRANRRPHANGAPYAQSLHALHAFGAVQEGYGGIMWTLWILAACGQLSDRPSPLTEPAVSATEVGPAYAQRLADIAQRRAALPTSDLASIRTTFADSVLEVVHAWRGTPWDFYGTATTPGDGPIACGHFVAGVLHDVGLSVERRKLGQQAAEHIILTLTSEASVRRYRGASVQDVVAGVVADGPGIYVVGLDHHVGFLVHHPGVDPHGVSTAPAPIGFCHSSWLNDIGVVCEDPLRSPALPSRYTVVGKLDEAALMRSWTEQAPIATVTR